MLKKSTLLSVSIFFLLFIGLSDYGYGCHKGEKHGKFTGCDEQSGGGGDEVLVVFFGEPELFGLFDLGDDGARETV